MRCCRNYPLSLAWFFVATAGACSSTDSAPTGTANSGASSGAAMASSGASSGITGSGANPGSSSGSGAVATSGSVSPSGSASGATSASSSGAASSSGSGSTSGGGATSGSGAMSGSGSTPGPGDAGPGSGLEAGPFTFDSGATSHLIVAADGSGQFKTVQAAFDSIPATNTTPIEVDVRPGTYAEKVSLLAGKAFVTLMGTDPDPAKTVITHGDTMANGISTFMTPTVQILADSFSAVNITFENSWVPVASGQNQALALSINGNHQQFRNCRFISYQDTVYVGGGTQYFKNCFVQGSVDYIFGESTAVFDACTMYNVKNGSAVAAPSTLQTQAYGLVFLGGQLTAAPGVSNVALGRPWRSAYAAVAFLNVALGAHVSPAGWTIMAAGVPDLSLVRFSEYKSTGPGANPTGRAKYQMTDAQAAMYTLPNVLGGWVPSLSF